MTTGRGIEVRNIWLSDWLRSVDSRDNRASSHRVSKRTKPSIIYFEPDNYIALFQNFIPLNTLGISSIRNRINHWNRVTSKTLEFLM